MEILRACQLQFIYLYSLLFVCPDTSIGMTWSRKPTFDNKLATSGYNITARSRIHCCKTCSSHSTCVSFFFAPSKDVNCQLHDSILTSPATLQSILASTYYTLDGNVVPTPVSDRTIPPFTCPPDDLIFRKVKLEDGSVFSYKVIKVIANMTESTSLCEGQGGFLARVTSIAKMNMLLQLLNSCQGYSGEDYYLDGSNAGAVNPFSADAWVMSNGDPVPMTTDYWGAGRPDVPEIQHCLRMRFHINYKLDNCSCDKEFYFICEK